METSALNSLINDPTAAQLAGTIGLVILAGLGLMIFGPMGYGPGEVLPKRRKH